MKLTEVLKPLLKQKLMEGQADNLVGDQLNSLANLIEKYDLHVEMNVGDFEYYDIESRRNKWKEIRILIQNLPNSWKIFVAKYYVADTLKGFWDYYGGQEFFNNRMPQLARHKLERKVMENMAKYLAVSYVNIQRIEGLLHSLRHYGGIQYPPIQQLNPIQNDYSTQEFINKLEELEEEYQEKQEEDKQYVEPAGTKILDFPDEFAWYNLGVEQCDYEADAMGHCGNADARAGDEILSLRSLAYVEGEVYREARHKPHLTFIVNDGFLGEMKGRNNQKPSSKYHPYIVELLKQPFIEGIVGHGYMPQNNFELSDLDQSQLEEIRQVKGDEFINKEGDISQRYDKFFDAVKAGTINTQHVAEQFNEILEESQDDFRVFGDIYSLNGDELVIDDVPKNPTWSSLVEHYEGGDRYYEMYDLPPPDDNEYFVDAFLPEKAKFALVNYMLKRKEQIIDYWPEDITEEDIDEDFIDDNFNELIQLSFDEIEMAINDLYHRGHEAGAEKNISKALKEALGAFIDNFDLKEITVPEFIDDYKGEHIPLEPLAEDGLRRYFNALAEHDEDDFQIIAHEPWLEDFDEDYVREEWKEVFDEHDIKWREI